MSDFSVSWLSVAPSAWRHRLRCLALTLTAGSLSAPVLVHVSPSTLLVAVATGCTMLVVAGIAWRAVPGRDEREWCITADGRIAVRCNEELWRDVSAVFVSRFLIVLQYGKGTLEVWRDATPIPAFRRLSVAGRWRPPHGGPSLTGVNEADATERT